MQLASLFSSWTRLLRRERLGRRQRGALPTGCGQRRPTLELLEHRLAPATLTVNSSADTASNGDAYLSLREALAIVNSPTLPSGLSEQILGQISGDLHDGGSDTIGFNANAIDAPIVLGGTQLELSLPASTATVTIDGGTGVTLDGNHASGVLQVDSGVQATLDHVTITHGNGPGFPGGGGGIANYGALTMTNSTISANSAGADASGGGIFNTGALTVSNCTLEANSAIGGGGIYNDRGTVTVTNSTLSANSASLDGGGIDNSSGTLTVSNSTFSANSGVSEGGGIGNSGTLTVSNSTFSANSASVGGGIDNHANLTVSNSTLAANSADLGGGIFSFAPPPSVVVVQNTILAGNSTSATYGGPDIAGAVDSSSSYNLVGIADSTFSGISNGSQGNQIGSPSNPIDPLLAPLGDQGGPTQTMALLPGSPTLNAGDPSQAGVADQRGAVRSGGVYIGAFQASAASFVITAPDTATTGVAFDVSVAVVDSFGRLAVGYTGTIRFSSTDSDPGVILPPDYTFGASDGGMATFSAGVTLFTPGEQTLTVTDPDSGLAASTIVTL
jgi:hypothetical protein